MLESLGTLLEALQGVQVGVLAVLDEAFLSATTDLAAQPPAPSPAPPPGAAVVVGSLSAVASRSPSLTVVAAVVLVAAREDAAQRRRDPAQTQTSSPATGARAGGADTGRSRFEVVSREIFFLNEML
jgi:hypothetical protein